MSWPNEKDGDFPQVCKEHSYEDNSEPCPDCELDLITKRFAEGRALLSDDLRKAFDILETLLGSRWHELLFKPNMTVEQVRVAAMLVAAEAVLADRSQRASEDIS